MPCVACNRDVKFGSLLQRARAWDAAAVATGHYARITRDRESGRFLLWRGRDARKDQSDFLWPLTQAQLAAARFPVGDLTKEAVREKARAAGPRDRGQAGEPGDLLHSRRRLPGLPPPADPGGLRARARSWTGRVPCSGSTRAWSTTRWASDAASACPRADRSTSPRSIPAGTPSWSERPPRSRWTGCGPSRSISSRLPALTGPLAVAAKIRHSHEPGRRDRQHARARRGGAVRSGFERAQRAPAPGQSVVFYQGDLVVGGGVIARPEAP